MQKSNANYQPIEFDLTKGDRVVSKSLGELDNLILENSLLGENSLDSNYLEPQSSFTPKKAIYIAELDNQFYFLDYFTESEPQPKPIEAHNLASTKLLSISNPKAELNLAKSSANPASFLNNKGLLVGLGLGILLTLGATRLLVPGADNQSESEPVPIAESTVTAQTVTITEVETSSINSTIDASGTVAAFESIPVMSQASGLQITEILAERGDFVERGQVLARLNNKALLAQEAEAQAAVAQQKAVLDELQAGSRVEEIAQAESRVSSAKTAVAKAESDLELIQKRVERNRSLQAEGAITRDRLDQLLNEEKVAVSDLAGTKASLNEAQQALAQLKAGSRPEAIAQAKAQLDQARGRLQAIETQLEDTTIVAPTNGIIASRDARVGQITSTSEMLFSIIQDGRLELRLKIPETLIGRIQRGQKVRITSNADKNLQLTGEVREIEPTIDDASRQAIVKVDLPNNAKLKPGMFLRAAINTDTNPGLAVPIESLLPQSGDKAIAFIVRDNNTVKAQTVEMGEIINEQQVEIVSGLQAGDRLVIKGAAYLKDGDKIKISDNY